MKSLLSTLAAGKFAKALGGTAGNLPIFETGAAAMAARIAARSLPLTLAVAGAGLALAYWNRKSDAADNNAARYANATAETRKRGSKRAKPAVA